MTIKSSSHLERIATLSLGGQRHRGRWLQLAAAAWGGMTLTWRGKLTLSFSRGDGRRRFFGLIEGSREWVPRQRSERFWSTFIWWCHIRWGIRSLVQWNLVERFVTRKTMFVASLSLFAIYVLPHFPTFHSWFTVLRITTAGNRAYTLGLKR